MPGVAQEKRFKAPTSLLTYVLIGVGIGLAFLGISHLLQVWTSGAPDGSAAAKRAVQAVADHNAYHFKPLREFQEIANPGEIEVVQRVLDLGKTYHKQTSQIELGECPPAFRAAYQRHVSSWSDVLERLEAVLADEKITQRAYSLAEAVEETTRPLETTWESVRQAALKQGVVIRQ